MTELRYTTCISPVKPEGQFKRCILMYLMFRSFGAESGKDVGNYLTSCGVRDWPVLAKGIFRRFLLLVYMAYIAHIVTRM